VYAKASVGVGVEREVESDCHLERKRDNDPLRFEMSQRSAQRHPTFIAFCDRPRDLRDGTTADRIGGDQLAQQAFCGCDLTAWCQRARRKSRGRWLLFDVRQQPDFKNQPLYAA
jgi:hypothetical protein